MEPSTAEKPLSSDYWPLAPMPVAGGLESIPPGLLPPHIAQRRKAVASDGPGTKRPPPSECVVATWHPEHRKSGDVDLRGIGALFDSFGYQQE